MAFIEQRSRGALQWRQFWLIIGANKMGNKYTALLQKSTKLGGNIRQRWINM